MQKRSPFTIEDMTDEESIEVCNEQLVEINKVLPMFLQAYKE